MQRGGDSAYSTQLALINYMGMNEECWGMLQGEEHYL